MASAAPRRVIPAALLLAALLPAARADAQYFEPFPRRPDVVVPAARGQSLEEIPGLSPAVAARVVQGDYPVLVIPALFSDSEEPHVLTADIQSTLFAGSGRTVTTYYREASDQRIYVDGTVASWVRTSVPTAQAAGVVNGHGWVGDRADEHFREAVAAVDGQIDFTQFDNDGPDGVPDSGDDNGIVDGVVFVNIEVAGSCGGPGFWPHFAGLTAEDGSLGVETADIGASGAPIRIIPYIADSAVDCDANPQGPSVLAHEFGHLIGLPDYYRRADGLEAERRHWAIGCFGIMGAGAWGCGSGEPPAQFGPTFPSPLSKSLLGWIELEEVGYVTDQEYLLEPVQTSRRALSVPLSPNSDEYFLIEYRPRLSFDDVLPDDGVLIYHVNPGRDILGSSADVPNYRHQLLEADGDSALRKVRALGGNRGVAADMFARGGATDAVPRHGAPSTAHHGGLPAALVIHSIRVENGVARIRLSNTSPLDAQPTQSDPAPTALAAHQARYRITGGTPPYTVHEPVGGLPVDALSLRLAGPDEIVVEGTILDQGDLTVPLSVEDASGNAWYGTHALHARDAELARDRLIQELILNGRAGSDIARYLDNAGNENGRYDVGDLRAYLQRTGALSP